MPRKAEVSYEEVATTAQTLADQGTKPTQRAIWEKLGGRGSMTTVSLFLRKWRDEKAPLRPAEPEALPYAVLAPLIDEIRRREDQARAGLMDEIEELRKESEAILEESNRRAEALDEHKARCEDMERNVAAISGRRDELAGVVTDLRQSLEKEQGRIEDVKRVAAVERLESEKIIVGLQAKIEAFVKSADEQLEKLGQLTSERDRALMDFSACDKAHDAANTRCQHLERELAHSSGRCKELEGAVVDYRQSLARERERAEGAEKNVAGLQAKNEALVKSSEEQHEKLVRLASEKDRALAESAALASQLDDANRNGRNGDSADRPRRLLVFGGRKVAGRRKIAASLKSKKPGS